MHCMTGMQPHARTLPTGATSKNNARSARNLQSVYKECTVHHTLPRPAATSITNTNHQSPTACTGTSNRYLCTMPHAKVGIHELPNLRQTCLRPRSCTRRRVGHQAGICCTWHPPRLLQRASDGTARRARCAKLCLRPSCSDGGTGRACACTRMRVRAHPHIPAPRTHACQPVCCCTNQHPCALCCASFTRPHVDPPG